AGHEVVETVLTLQDVRDADEAFSTGNANKIVPIVAFDDREYGLGPVAAEVRKRYWDYAHEG
ncbi:MAG: branched chain amino acid aminotransferase, partial [Pseudomonadota bacterium]